jgi:hypothetical protein
MVRLEYSHVVSSLFLLQKKKRYPLFAIASRMAIAIYRQPRITAQLQASVTLLNS